MDDAVDNAAGSMFNSPIEPAQIAKKAEKMMNREKLVGAGCQYAPTLYTVLVNREDDQRLFGFYPTMAAEIETYLLGAAEDAGLVFDCRPLVRFIAQDGLKSGKFDVVAENVAGSIIEDLRREEAEYYGMEPEPAPAIQPGVQGAAPVQVPYQGAQRASFHAPVQVPLDEPQQDFYQEPTGNAGYDDYGYQPGYADPGYPNQDYAEGGYADADPYGQNYMPQTMNLPGRGAAPVVGNAGTMRGQISEPFLVDMQDNRSFPLASDHAVIGRESSSDFQIMDSNVSRSHAEVFYDQSGRWFIRDLGSTNGTKVNGRRISEAPLSHGDIITMGTTRVEFREN